MKIMNFDLIFDILASNFENRGLKTLWRNLKSGPENLNPKIGVSKPQIRNTKP